MSGFTDEERAAEMKRRDDAIRNSIKAWERSMEAARIADMQRMDTRCLHCNNPMHSWQATDPEIPLCDFCLGD
ncbi:hypothetical protein [Rhizobium sp. YTU87027]|uniref:hypothetical protein n=1 Tax=Rhizobium sp. YTU87027 TaxID=3417741 RepID=UPI003D681566